MAANLLLRATPLLRHRLTQRGGSAFGFITWMGIPSRFRATDRSQVQDNVNNGGGGTESTAFRSDKDTSNFSQWEDSPDYRQWKDKEAEMFRDIEPIVTIAKEILHTGRYVDGERLSDEDEKAVVEKLLAYHPHSEDKIGPGLDSIMVDRHPQFRYTRCLFVVRTDGGWIDFSYQKCLRAYIRDKYPTYAERFIGEHFKRAVVNSSSI